MNSNELNMKEQPKDPLKEIPFMTPAIEKQIMKVWCDELFEEGFFTKEEHEKIKTKIDKS